VVFHVSITKTRNFLEKSGCGWVVGIVLVIVFAIGFLWQGNRGPTVDEQEREQGVAIARIGDYVVSDKNVEEMIDRQKQQYPPDITLPPIMEASDRARVLFEAVNQGLTLALARQKGIDPTDGQILDSVKSQVETSLMQARFQMMSSGQLKPDSTEADFDKFLKSNPQIGMTAKEYVEKIVDEHREKLEDKNERAGLAVLAAQPLVRAAIENSLNPPDDEVKRAQGTITAKAVTFSFSSEGEAKAARVLKEIKAGLSFEAAMGKYSNDTPPKGKKKTEVTEDVDMFSVMLRESLKPLRNLKPGQISDVVSTPNGPKIYKIVKIKEMSKADYEKGKSNFRQTYVRDLAQSKMQDEITGLRDKIRWESDGYKFLYQWYVTAGDTKIEKKAREAKVDDIAADAKKLVKDGEDDIGQSAALAAWYLAVESNWNSAAPAAKEKLRDERIEVLEMVYDDTPDNALAIELADLLIKEKNKKAFKYVLDVATANQDFEPANDQFYKQVDEKLKKLKALGLVSPEDEKKIREEQARWKKEKALDDQDKKLEEEQRKKDEAEQKKKDAEAKKKEEASKPQRGPLRPTDPEPKKPAPKTTGK
jgi:hypothetical protein